MRRAVVCHITTAHRADDVRIFERECRALADSGKYEVHLIAPGEMPVGASVTAHPLPMPPRHRVGRIALAQLRARTALRRVDADVYHFHDPELIPVANSLARSGERVIWDAHEDYFTQLEDPLSREWIPRPLRSAVQSHFRRSLERTDKHAAGIVAATATIAGKYQNAQTVVVGNEARLSDFSAAAPTYHSRQVLFTGMASPYHLFREACRAVEKQPELTLAIGGRDVPPAERQYAESLLQTRVAFLGWLGREALVSEINRSIVGLATYADYPAYETGTSTKLFEFMAAGLPVICTPNPSNRETVNESNSGLVMKDFTEESLSTALSKLTSAESTWLQMSRSGRDFVGRRGGWRESESALIELYDSILGE